MSSASIGAPYVITCGPARATDARITAKVRRSICGVTSTAQRSGVVAVGSATARQCSGRQLGTAVAGHWKRPGRNCPAIVHDDIAMLMVTAPVDRDQPA